MPHQITPNSSIDLNKIHRVLFIKLRHIGDVLLATATFKAMKRAKPDIRISVVVPAGTEEMVSLNPSIDRVIPLERGRGLWHEIRFILGLRAGGYDLAVNMTEGDRGALLSLLSGAPLRIGIDPHSRGFRGKKLFFTHLVAPFHTGRHRAVMDMDVLTPLGIESGVPEVELYTSQEDDAYVGKLLSAHGVDPTSAFAVVHPTSRWLFKCWQDESVARVIDTLDGMGLRTVVTSGPDEKERHMLGRILSHARSTPVDLSGRLTLKQLGSLLKRSALFFGVDSAPMHMAAALGTPVVVLFGPSDSSVWAPLSNKSKVIAKMSDFPCMPCRKDGCQGSKKSACLDSITVEEVVAAIRQLLEVHGDASK